MRGCLAAARAILFKHGKAAVDLAPRRAPLLDGAREVRAEARIQKVIIVADLKARLGKKIGKISAQVVTDLLQRLLGPDGTQRLRPPLGSDPNSRAQRGANVEPRHQTMQ